MIKNTIALTNYNLWANKRIGDWLLSNDREQLEVPCLSSFPTIMQTIQHILDAQAFYLSILKQESLIKNSHKIIQEAIDSLITQSEVFAQYVSQLDSEKLNTLRTVNIKALSGDFTQQQLIQHCMNHSTFHRGQIITMGHQLQLTKAPSTDLFYYIYLIEKTSDNII